MRKLSIILPLCLLVCFTSCHTKQQVASHTTKHRKIDPNQKIVEQLLAAAPDFQTAQAQKARISIKTGDNQISANAAISMIKDSAIIISVQPLLGIELFRIEIDKNSFTVIDKLNYRYSSLTYTELQQFSGLDITYPIVQAFVMNRACVLGNDATDALLQQKYEVEINDNKTIVSFTNNRLNYRYTYTNDNSQLSATVIQKATDSSSVNYSAHQLFGEVFFPTVIDITYSSEKLVGGCMISLQKIQFNGKVDAKRMDVSRYKKVSLTQMLQ